MSLAELLAAQPVLWVASCAIFGLVIGSFLNVVILRLPRMMEHQWRRECALLLEQDAPADTRYDLIHPPSTCPGCGTRIRPWQNVPLLSFALLRGRCGQCAQPISWQYPAVEAGAGALAAAVALSFPPGATALAAALLVFSLLTLAVIDLRTQLLPDSIVLPLLWAGLCVNLFGLFAPLADAVIGAVAGYLSLWLVFHAFRLATGKEGMGYGDFKLFAALGAWFGWQSLPLIILVASASGSVLGGLMLVSGALERGKPMPFGPYLAAGGLLLLFFRDTLAGWLMVVSG